MNTHIIRSTTLWLAIAAVAALIVSLYFLFARHAPSFAGEQGSLSNSARAQTRGVASHWDDVVARVRSDVKLGNYDSAVGAVNEYTNDLLSQRVSAQETSSLLRFVIGLTRLTALLQAQASVTDIESAVNALTP